MKKLAYIGFTAATLAYFAVFTSLCFSAFAAPFAKQKVVEAAEINAELKQVFPITKTYKQITATFYQPNIEIDATDESVEVELVIRTEQANKALIAKGKLKGSLEFYEFDKTLRLKKPVLDNFSVVTDELDNSLEAQKVIQQSMSRNFRDIVLFDVSSLGLEFPDEQPQRIEISINKLILYW